MKQQIRKSVFETNSSSTHAMAIQSFPNILYGIYTNMTDEQIDKFNDDDETKEGWQCKIIKKKDLPAVVTFHEGEFGWGIRTIKSDDYETKASYLYTLMSESLSYDEFDETVKRFEKWLNEEGVACEFQKYEKVDKPIISEYEYTPNRVQLIRENENDWGYVDHGDEAEDFLCYVISRKGNFFNYLFGDSFIKMGNDNMECDISLCTEDDHWTFDCTHKKFYKGN